jgi:DNA-binding LacI/PurR family transcriptional regulator
VICISGETVLPTILQLSKVEIVPKEQQKLPSINDVAALAGASKSTVSRYLNGNGYVSDEKRHSIAKAIQMLDYKPSTIARALVSNESKSIAVISSDISLYGSMQLIEGIEQGAREKGYMVSVTRLDGDLEDARDTVNTLARSRPLGCILLDLNKASSLHALVPYIEGLLPAAVINEGKSSTDALSLGAFEGGYQVTKYLLGLGHKTVYHVSIPENDNKFTRYLGWKTALEEAGAPIPDPLGSSWDPRAAESAGQYLAAVPEVTAIFAGNDEVAAGVIRGLSKAGKRIPEDVSVAGFDGNPIAAIMLPSITTWIQDFQGIGRRSINTLLLNAGKTPVANPASENVSSSAARLVIRESTARPLLSRK